MRREIWASDNLEMLQSLDDSSAHLVYIDPPFASNRTYEAVLSRSRHAGREVVRAFDDRWGHPASAGHRDRRLAEFLSFAAASVSRDMYGYLIMMGSRLVESHRILNPRGSLYLHCDPAASHYLKVMLDLVFGAENFRNEIIWKRTHAHSSARRFGPVHDVILFYSRGPDFTWNPAFTAYDPSYLEKHFTQVDDRGSFQLITCTAPGDRPGTRAHYEWRGQLPPPGRHWAWRIERMMELEAAGLLVHSVNGVPRMKHYAEDGKGVALQDVWIDIKRLDANSEERVGYDTQKPLALIERIISASTPEGALVVDAFAGSGTTAVAAERLKREWIISDSSLLAASFALSRTRQVAGRASIRLTGFPDSEKSAVHLLRKDPQTFGVWGTAMLATVTARSTFSTSVATGTGRFRTDRRDVEVMSWVPLEAGAVPESSPRSSRRRLPSVGFVLRADRSVTQLAKWINRSMPALPLKEVSVDRLVAAATRTKGFSGAVSEMAEAAK